MTPRLLAVFVPYGILVCAIDTQTPPEYSQALVLFEYIVGQ
jgi:hypothetical protein